MVYWLVFCLVVGCASTAFMLVRGRAGRNAYAARGSLHVGSVPDTPVSWAIVGGAVLPGAFGKTNATWPLAVMEGGTGWVRIRIRPGFIAAMFGTHPLVARPTDDVEVFPARGMFGTAFVGIRVGHQDGYFGCTGRAELMDRLRRLGYRVTSEERKIVYF